jgi:hypothetical protein
LSPHLYRSPAARSAETDTPRFAVGSLGARLAPYPGTCRGGARSPSPVVSRGGRCSVGLTSSMVLQWQPWRRLSPIQECRGLVVAAPCLLGCYQVLPRLYPRSGLVWYLSSTSACIALRRHRWTVQPRPCSALRFALAVLAPQCAIRVWTRLRDAFRFRLRRRVVSSVCVAFRAHWRHSGSLVVISAE